MFVCECPHVIVCVTDAMFVCECMWQDARVTGRKNVCVVVHAVWDPVCRKSSVKSQESRLGFG